MCSSDLTDAARRGPAIDPVFKLTRTESYFWSSTTHLDGPVTGARAVYVAFGRAWGNMTDPRTGRKRWMDVHGAGAQRSDPKTGDPDDYSEGLGPQGDDIRIYNYARAVCHINPATVKIVIPLTTVLPQSARPRHLRRPSRQR